MEITLNNGLKMPIIGLGVGCIYGKDVRNLINNAIKIGYRHCDCAAEYQNEAEDGAALSEEIETGLVKRDDPFITTKACNDSLKKLKLDYLDLYLVHVPIAIRYTGIDQTGSPLGKDGVLDNVDTTISLKTCWHAVEDLVSKGLARSIGIRIQRNS